ncbi:GNAT family N-acetyltransferase [Nitratireductor kimnyeongensis]|uniref:GNAT family N-acetyltransferase n=1 Tax=Nitratireductor kimnyeongensis TaxID=430679 RepID=A0ABW0TAK4_9HYPH|nr:GNAT family N-acetyltransferase [Nitratireductor kimnyeongensis]QZZ35642.1 GNAT family N-acetyltransferase [Nitratireductor kimnyeongensis]
MVTGIDAGTEGLLIRIAERRDVEAIVALFAADAVGGHGDTTDPDAAEAYLAAFERISDSPNDTLYVAELDGAVVGTFQTTLIPGIPGRGGTSFQIEAVQTRKDMRGRGIGALMINHAIEAAKTADTRLVQLMSNAVRERAHGFYERLGFAKSHVGFKMKLK